jgi:ATP phosphoribosyltransferase regulatory subunit
VLSGGRYDNLLGQFGRPAPATGFSLKTNRILEYVAANGAGAADGPERVLIAYTSESRDDALREAGALRAVGNDAAVTTARVDDSAEFGRLRDGAASGGGVIFQGVGYDRVLTFGRGSEA